jgi:hypothetical protein
MKSLADLKYMTRPKSERLYFEYDIEGARRNFKALAQISANVLADPELEQPDFRKVRSQLAFRD